jgi:hypothetical protein
VYRFLEGKPEGKRPLGDLGVDGCIILGWVFGKRAVYSLLVGKLEGKRSLGDLFVDGWIILGWVCM